ncbi:putative dna damage response protein [Phaeomoniella chlamydospora]|uniref:Putative dna damage response protein n=1 Tax=Phaeomoniella chlamydospora TaxID=158046 RepID=A0A0G2F3F8_PHACM|nr:putative dna damage response protein [Phaeomoniella chlamydospora]
MSTETITPPPATAATITPTFTPINVLLLTVLAYLIYTSIFRPSSANAPPLLKPNPPIVYQTYTPRTLLPFNGLNNSPVFLAVRGKVFDCSPGRNFYGPGGPYSNFAGRDATRGLACQSFDEEMLTVDLDGPLYEYAKLGEEERENLKGWEERFLDKYLVVGELVSKDEFERRESEGKI